MGTRRGRSAVVAVALVLCVVAAACGTGNDEVGFALERAAAAPPAEAQAESDAAVPTSVADPPPPPTTAAPPPPTTAAPPPPPTAAAPPVPAPTVAPLRPEGATMAAAVFTLAPYTGLGTWLDVYDWSMTYARGRTEPAAGLADIDRMASLGAQTLYIQATKWDAPTDVLEPERLLPLIERAHSHGMAVVAWYLPTLEDPAADLRRLLAIAALDVEGLAVDIEATNVADPAERSRRIVDLSRALRAALPGRVLGAIPLDPVTIEVINPRYWPGFPWRELAPLYDVWMPMAYWTFRKQSSGYRDGYRYTAENIDRTRANLGLPEAPVHALGGIGDRSSPEQVQGMLRATSERRGIGGSLYDYRTTHDALWAPLQGFRRPP